MKLTAAMVKPIMLYSYKLYMFITNEGRDYMAHVIVIAHEKGGCGKSSCVIGLAEGLHDRSKSVLCVDCDPQGSLSGLWGLDSLRSAGLYEVLEGKADVHDVIKPVKLLLDVLPSSISLTAADYKYYGKPNGKYIIRELLFAVRDDYDFILIDTPSSLSFMVTCAVMAADYVLIPTLTEFASLQTLLQTKPFLERIQKDNKGLSIMGIVLTSYSPQLNTTKAIEPNIQRIAEAMHSKILNTRIRKSQAICNRQAAGKSILTGKSKASEDFHALADEVIGIIEGGIV